MYSELTGGQRARGHLAAARLLAQRPGANERVAEHLLASEPASDAWVVERLVQAARAAARSGAPESAAAYLRRALDEPPAAADRPGLLLELGHGRGQRGRAGWPTHLEAAIAAADDEPRRRGGDGAGARARPGAPVGRRDRGARPGGVAARSEPAELAVRLEAAAVGVGMIDVATAAAVAARRDALPGGRRTTRGAAGATRGGYVRRGAHQRAGDVGERAGPADAGGRARGARSAAPTVPGTRTQRGSRRPPCRCCGPSTTSSVRAAARRVDREGPRDRDSGRFAVGLAHRAWVALRRGDLSEAEADARTALAAAELPAPTFYRVLNGGVLIDALVEQGELDGGRGGARADGH